jgi:hypothetical protein
MKTDYKICFCIYVIITVITCSCNSKTNAENQRGLKIIDSLKITDPDEKKVCIEFDGNVTDFISQLEAVATDSANFKPGQNNDIEKKFDEKMDLLTSKLNDIKKQISSDAIEKKKIGDFSAYEIQRLFIVAAKYNKTK